MHKQLKNFMEQLKNNPELIEAIKSAKNMEEAYEMSKPYFKEEMSEGEFNQILKQIHDIGTSAEAGELSNEDLDNVSGGGDGRVTFESIFRIFKEIGPMVLPVAMNVASVVGNEFNRPSDLKNNPKARKI